MKYFSYLTILALPIFIISILGFKRYSLGDKNTLRNNVFGNPPKLPSNFRIKIPSAEKSQYTPDELILKLS
jgi:hypothetical protein